MQEALVALLQQVMNVKAAEEERKRPRASKSKPANPANDPKIPWDQNKPHIVKYEVNHRDVEHNALLVCPSMLSQPSTLPIVVLFNKGYIRYLMYDKLGREGPSDPLPPSPPPEIAAPTPRAFFIRWEESENSLFNQTAARIIADQVVTDWPGIQGSTAFPKLQTMVTMHIKYLQTCWTRQNDPEAESKEARRLRRCRADTRKRTVRYLSVFFACRANSGCSSMLTE